MDIAIKEDSVVDEVNDAWDNFSVAKDEETVFVNAICHGRKLVKHNQIAFLVDYHPIKLKKMIIFEHSNTIYIELKLYHHD